MSGSFEKTFEPWCVREGEQPVVPLFEYGESMSKVASSLDEVPNLQKYINKAQPEDGWYTLLIHANGTDEVWGPNKKGDSFPISDLVPAQKTAEYGYQTFEKTALGYVHHRNTPDKWTGRVLMAEFNKAMGRVELIAKFAIKRLIEEGAPYFAESLQNGELPAVSMGCRVPYDVCSICGNKAPNVRHYCDHLKFERLTTRPDGRRVRMFNVKPVFHDISLVSSPADPAARVLLKVAEEDEKLSAMTKRTPVEPVGGIRRINKNEYAATVSTAHDPDVTLDTLVRASKINKHASLSAFTAMGVLLRPHEYATIELLRSGEFHKAAQVYETRSQFPVAEARSASEFTWTDPDMFLVHDLQKMAADRSVYIPALEERLKNLDEKRASGPLPETLDIPVPDEIQATYAGYRKTAEKYLTDGTATKWASMRPDILGSLLGRDISIILNNRSLDAPETVFGGIVRGANLPLIQL